MRSSIKESEKDRRNVPCRDKLCLGIYARAFQPLGVIQLYLCPVKEEEEKYERDPDEQHHQKSVLGVPLRTMLIRYPKDERGEKGRYDINGNEK